MCINHYEYAKGPSRTIRKVGHEDIDMDIDSGATGIQTYTANNPQEYSFLMELFDQGMQQSKTSSTTESNPVVTTSTTTIFTPGIDNTRAAMEIKGVADNLLGATGAVLGGTAALLSTPGAFYLGVTSGEQAGRNVGNVMWNIIDSRFWDGPGNLAGRYNKGQTYGEKGWGSRSGY